jgi:hypothetical protein
VQGRGAIRPPAPIISSSRASLVSRAPQCLLSSRTWPSNCRWLATSHPSIDSVERIKHLIAELHSCAITDVDNVPAAHMDELTQVHVLFFCGVSCNATSFECAHLVSIWHSLLETPLPNRILSMTRSLNYAKVQTSNAVFPC